MFRLYSKSSFHLPSHIFFKFSSADPSEGDLNLSPSRSSFISGLTEQTKNTLKTDSDCFIHQSLSTPCLNVLKSCRGSYLKDLNGMKILDFHGNSVHQVGHRNKYVIKAIKKQMKKLSFCPRRYTNDPAIKLAQKLIEKTRSQDKELSGGELGEPQLTRVLFCPGGTSAMGIALKLARIATNRHKTLSMWDSFHGASLDCISIGGEAIFRKGIGPLMSGSEHVPPCDPFRCVFGCGGTCNYRCVDYVEYVFEKERDIGALIAEPIRWTPYAPPVEYWKRIRAICDKYGAKLIFDEIPNSLGRNGTTFFTYQMYGIVPDILVIGKGLGGGILPLAGILCKEELNEFGKEIALGHYTHEKNPVLCAAGLATIKYIEKYDLVNEAREKGQFLRDELLKLKEKYPIIGDVRGEGLLLGVELVKSDGNRAIEEADKILYECLRNGLSFKTTMGNILTLCPPLTITYPQLVEALNILDISIQAVMDEKQN